jgi:hypothetical protein
VRTLTDAVDQFAYHPGTPEVAPTYAALRMVAIEVVEQTWDLVPDGPEKTLALRGLQQWLMYSNLAVALTVPADHETPHIARTLPTSSSE